MTVQFIILLQISLSLLFFWSAYVLFIRRIHQFGMQRLYLNISLLISLLMPVLVAVFEPSRVIPESLWLKWPMTADGLTSEASSPVPGDAGSFSWWWAIAGLYLAGVGFRTVILLRELVLIHKLYSSARKEARDGQVLYYEGRIRRPFSFFHLIFLNAGMNENERQYTVSHESAHVRGHHSWDNLLFELAKVLLWFHPCMYLYKRYLNEVHEYLADQEVIRQSASRKSYAHFLLENTCHSDGQQLILGLSNKLITKRIVMLSKPSLRPITYLYMLMLIPLGVLSFTACSMLEEEPAAMEEVIEVPDLDAEYAKYEGMTINSLTWKGNTLYSDQELARSVGIEAGEMFKSSLLMNTLAYSPTGEDIGSLYMDNGYLFFSINPVVTPAGEGRVDLTFEIYEGEVVNVGTVCVTTEEGLSSSLMDYVDVRPGELFSRSALISTSQKLTDATNGMVVNAIPKPYPDQGLVDIEFAITKSQAN